MQNSGLLLFLVAYLLGLLKEAAPFLHISSCVVDQNA